MRIWLCIFCLACGSTPPSQEASPAAGLTQAAPAPTAKGRPHSQCDDVRPVVVEALGREVWRELGDRLIDLLDTPDIEILCKSLIGKTADEVVAAVEKIEAEQAAKLEAVQAVEPEAATTPSIPEAPKGEAP